MEESPRIPPAALSEMKDWETTVVWSLVPERVTWRLRAANGETRFLKVYTLGQELRLSHERDRLEWAATRLPVPPVLAAGSDGEYEWLLTAGLPGVNAIDEGLRADPSRLVPLLADGLRRLHALSVDDCPFDYRLETALPIAQRRVVEGLVNAERDLRRDHGELTAEAALAQLLRLRPRQEDLVVCHGDYCLPNVLVSNGRVTGYLDLGRLGVADRWWDLAVAIWSITHNLGPGWEDLFLDAYGIQRDPEKIAFYRLLYDRFP
ncbi:MAG TPA: APH(3') family aminoglycoside O-phosphotransferase [Chloroflexota bacterium]|nr:APH(3') family aminoglycoside O-phosphotransferase [Chloroflexota bacterium]